MSEPVRAFVITPTHVRYRPTAGQLAATSSRLVQLRCHAPAEVIADRIARRRGTGDPSDATAEIAARIDAEFDPWPQATEVPTTMPVQTSADQALRAVTDAVAAKDFRP